MWGIKPYRSTPLHSHAYTHGDSKPDSFIHRDSYGFINSFPHRYAHTAAL